MADARITSDGIINWVKSTRIGRESWSDLHGDEDVEDYFADYGGERGFAQNVAMDLAYPGDEKARLEPKE